MPAKFPGGGGQGHFWPAVYKALIFSILIGDEVLITRLTVWGNLEFLGKNVVVVVFNIFSRSLHDGVWLRHCSFL